MKPAKLYRSFPFLLVGLDADGETREFHYDAIEAARKTAADCTCTDASGPAWQSWAIWGNDPNTEEWRVLEQSPQPETLIDEADQSAVLNTHPLLDALNAEFHSKL